MRVYWGGAHALTLQSVLGGAHAFFKRGERHYISACHKYYDDVTDRTQARPFEE